MKNKKLWNKPVLNTLKKDQINKAISLSACSKYIGGSCSPSTGYFIDSFPGSDKPIIM